MFYIFDAQNFALLMAATILEISLFIVVSQSSNQICLHQYALLFLLF